MKPVSILSLALAALLLVVGVFGIRSATAAPALQADDATVRTFRVTLTNLTAGQPFSPPVVVTHDNTIRLLNVGATASDALAAIAQAGDPEPMVELLSGLTNGVTDVVNVGQPLTPQGTTATPDEGTTITDTVAFTITAAPGDYLSFVAMLICTNDGLVGLDSANLPDPGEERLIALGAYDAGREANTEQSTDLPDSCSTLGSLSLPGDPNGNLNDAPVATTPPAAIEAHPGITGEADLTVAAHGWLAVAEITITPLADEAADEEVDEGQVDEEEAGKSGLVTLESSNSFTRTVTMLQDALTAQGLTIFATIDHAANAANAALDLLPTTLILAGNPNLGTPLMQASRSTAIDLPQKFLIWQAADGTVFVTYNAPAYLAQRHAISGQDAILDQIANALETFATAATSAPPPSVTVADQTLVTTTVTVAEAVSEGPGWVVIHADDAGSPGAVIGNSAQLTAGINSNLTVEIDSAAATETLYAMLHTDAGAVGVYEFPGPDSPVVVDGTVVAPAFTITRTTAPPTEEMTTTEEITPTEKVTITENITETGAVTGTTAVTATEGVTIPDPRSAIDVVPATEIPPIPITATATISDVLMVEVADQTIAAGVVLIDRVFNTGAGWIVIHADANGEPGAVLGQQLVINGLNEAVLVTIDPGEATETLWAMLHTDTGELGVFEFPDADPPVEVDGEIVMAAFTVLDSTVETTP
jgi:uncharacterized protein (DUF302 family)